MEGRRDFLKGISAGVGALAVGGVRTEAKALRTDEVDRSKVVVTHDPDAYTNMSKIQDMVDYAVMHLTGVSDKGEAYEALFPNGVTSSTIIAVKIGTISFGPSADTVNDALKNGLMSMLGGTFPEANIQFVDNSPKGRNGNPEITIGPSDWMKVRYADVWVDCDYIINRPPCWTHSLTDFGGPALTIGLKNMMGAVDQPWNLHDTFFDAANPSLGLLNSVPEIRDKTVLVLADAVTANSSGGPGGGANVAPCRIVATRGVVTNDFINAGILKDHQMGDNYYNTGLDLLHKCAQEKFGLGTDDPSMIELVELEAPFSLPTSTPNVRAVKGRTGSGPYLELRTNGSILPDTGCLISLGRVRGSVQLSIYSMSGRLVRSFEVDLQRSSNRTVYWNGCDSAGGRVSHGAYRVVVGDGSGGLSATIKI